MNHVVNLFNEATVVLSPFNIIMQNTQKGNIIIIQVCPLCCSEVMSIYVSKYLFLSLISNTVYTSNRQRGTHGQGTYKYNIGPSSTQKYLPDKSMYTTAEKSRVSNSN